MSATLVKTKKRCCKDSPRCKKCPVVWKRLSNADLAEREGTTRFYRADPALKKKQLKAARLRSA